jgi:hypothetical protein
MESTLGHTWVNANKKLVLSLRLPVPCRPILNSDYIWQWLWPTSVGFSGFHWISDTSDLFFHNLCISPFQSRDHASIMVMLVRTVCCILPRKQQTQLHNDAEQHETKRNQENEGACSVCLVYSVQSPKVSQSNIATIAADGNYMKCTDRAVLHSSCKKMRRKKKFFKSCAGVTYDDLQVRSPNIKHHVPAVTESFRKRHLCSVRPPLPCQGSYQKHNLGPCRWLQSSFGLGPKVWRFAGGVVTCWHVDMLWKVGDCSCFMFRFRQGTTKAANHARSPSLTEGHGL